MRLTPPPATEIYTVTIDANETHQPFLFGTPSTCCFLVSKKHKQIVASLLKTQEE